MVILFEFRIDDKFTRVDTSFWYNDKHLFDSITTAKPFGIKKYDGNVKAVFKSKDLPDQTIEIKNGVVSA